MENEVKDTNEIPKRKAKEKFNKMIIVNIATIIVLVIITAIKNIPASTVTQTSVEGLQFKPSIQTAYPFGLMFGVVKFLACLLMMAQVMKLSLDMVYLAFPFIRHTLGGSGDGKKSDGSISFISDLAKQEAEQGGSVTNYVVKSLPTLVLVTIIALFAMTDISSIVGLIVN